MKQSTTVTLIKKQSGR